MTESAPPTASLIASIPDLMAGVRVGEAARAAGVPLTNIDAEAWTGALAADPRPAGAVVDLTAPGAVGRIEAAVAVHVPVLAFGPHVDGSLLAAATNAGAQRVVARGRMMQQGGALMADLIAGRTGTQRSKDEEVADAVER